MSTNNQTDQKKVDEHKRAVQLNEVPGTYFIFLWFSLVKFLASFLSNL